MWLLFLYFIRIALVDIYAVTEGLIIWLYAGESRPYVPAIDDLFSTLRTYGLVILANGVILILWARYNQHRYGGPDQRLPDRLVSVADLAELYSQPVADVAHWQDSRIVVMTHDTDGTLREVTTRDAGPLVPAVAPRDRVST